MKENNINIIAEKSPLSDIRITIKRGGKREIVKFNLNKELEIEEAFIDQELNKNVSKYGFIGICLAKVSKQRKLKELEKKRIYAKKFIELKKERIDGKVPADSYTREKVQIDDDYIEVCKQLITLEESEDVLKHCVKTFENRSFMVQSMSANMRAETRMVS